MKNHPVTGESFRKNGRTGTTKLRDTFRSFVNAAKNALRRICKKPAVSMFLILVRNLPGTTEKTSKCLTEYCLTPDRYTDTGLTEYEGRKKYATFVMKNENTTLCPLQCCSYVTGSNDCHIDIIYRRELENTKKYFDLFPTIRKVAGSIPDGVTGIFH